MGELRDQAQAVAVNHPEVQVQVEEAGRSIRLSVPLLVAEAAAALIPWQRFGTETRSKLLQQCIHFLLCGRGQWRSLTEGKPTGTPGVTMASASRRRPPSCMRGAHLLTLMLMLHLLQRQPFTLFGCRPEPGESSPPGTARGRGFNFTFT